MHPVHDVYFDGACINNHLPNMNLRVTFSAFIIDGYSVLLATEAKSSNQAEYDALLGVLDYIHGTFPDRTEHIFQFIGDSELVVNQVLGRYRSRAPGLHERYDRVMFMLHGLTYTIEAIDRDHNPAGHLLENVVKLWNFVKRTDITMTRERFLKEMSWK